MAQAIDWNNPAAIDLRADILYFGRNITGHNLFVRIFMRNNNSGSGMQRLNSAYNHWRDGLTEDGRQRWNTIGRNARHEARNPPPAGSGQAPVQAAGSGQAVGSFQAPVQAAGSGQAVGSFQAPVQAAGSGQAPVQAAGSGQAPVQAVGSGQAPVQEDGRCHGIRGSQIIAPAQATMSRHNGGGQSFQMNGQFMIQGGNIIIQSPQAIINVEGQNTVGGNNVIESPNANIED